MSGKYYRVIADKGRATTAEVAQALQVKISTATVGIAAEKKNGVIRKVGQAPRKGRRPVYVWGPA